MFASPRPVRVAAATGHGEWSELGSRDIDHTTRGARVRERDAIESIHPSADQSGKKKEDEEAWSDNPQKVS
jgi:hypothetical protein